MRDGEPYVEYACRSTFPHADKIVIVDTGSKDNTIDIIRAVAAEFDKELVLIESPWLGFGPSRELAMPYIEDGWLWKIGQDEVWFNVEEKYATLRDRLKWAWEKTEYPYLYPTEWTMEGSHITRQGQMNSRTQFYRIENEKYVYTWGGMRTNDDLTRINRLNRRDQLFLGPLCGDVHTINKDPRFTAFVYHGRSGPCPIYSMGDGDPSAEFWEKERKVPPYKPDAIHFAKCTSKRMDWKTKTYRELDANWPEEGMGNPKEQKPYDGPWPEVLYDKDGNLPSWLQADLDRAQELWPEDFYKEKREVRELVNLELPQAGKNFIAGELDEGY